MDRTCRQKYLLANKGQNFDEYKILIVNSGPVCCEVVKNVLCMGFSKITICAAITNQTITKSDEYETFIFVNNLGRNKIETLEKKMQRIKEDVKITHFLFKTVSDVAQHVHEYDIVAVCDNFIYDDEIAVINNECRKYNIPFLAGDVKGLTIGLFSDFGNIYKYNDYSGNPNDIDGIPVHSIETSLEENFIIATSISSLTNTTPGCKIILKSIDESFECNLIENTHQPPFNTYKLQLDNLKEKNICKTRGYFLQSPPAVKGINHVPLNTFGAKCNIKEIKEKISNLGIPFMDYTFWYLYKKFGNQKNEDFTKYSREEILEFRNDLKDLIEPAAIPEQLWYDCYLTLIGKCVPLNTIVAGLISNQIFSAFTGNFKPVDQWLCYSFYYAIDTSFVREDLECRIKKVNEQIESNPQWLLFGDKILDKITKFNVLQVGCGATGCETAKLLSEIGVGKFGKLTLVDVDSYALSNRNRQFLCYSENVGHSKSTVANKNLKEFYPDHNIQSINDAVSSFPPDNKFFDDFYKEYDCFIGTVDNEKAREYLCKLALYHKKFFLECGTQSLKIQATVFKPPLNGNPGFSVYLRSEKQQVDKVIEDLNCYPKDFPYLDSHAIQSAVVLFNRWFGTYSTSKDAISAFNEEFYDKKVVSAQDASGWNELRRKPTPIKYDEHNPLHRQYSEKYAVLQQSDRTFDKDNIAHLEFIIVIATIVCDIFNIVSRNFDYFRVQRIAAHVNPSIITSGAIAAALSVVNFFTMASFSLDGVSQVWRNHFGDLSYHSFRPTNIRPSSTRFKSGYLLDLEISPEKSFRDLQEIIFNSEEIEPFIWEIERDCPESFPLWIAMKDSMVKIQPSKINQQIKSFFPTGECLLNTHHRLIIQNKRAKDYLFVRCSFV